MYKMLIAEQDIEQVELIREYTQNKFKEIEIVGVEDTGVSVLEFVEKNKLDIMVVAVQLKGASGLEVVRRIKERHKELQIIIISGFDYSDFVMDAMSYGVTDYMLKPLNMVEYTNVLAKIVEKLDGDRRNRVNRNLQERKKDQINVFVDYCFIYSFVWNDKSTYQIRKYQELLGLDEYGYVLNIEFGKIGKECVVDLDKDFILISHGIKDILSESVTCLVGPKLGKRMIVYVNQDKEEMKLGSGKTKAIALANKLRLEMVRCFGIEVRVGIGSKKKILEIHDSYEESIKALRYKEHSDVIHIEELVENTVSHKDYIEAETLFLQNAKLGKEECITQFAQLWEMLQQLNIHDAKNKVLEIIVILCHEIRVQIENEVNNLDYNGFMEQMNDMGWRELKDWAYSKVEYILKSVRTNRSTVKSAAVTEALAYINEHYNEELTLGHMAKYVNMTPQHFSKIFKEGTKMTYVEYLRNMRIKRAQEYLLQGILTISQISDAVGFKDANYFSRIFKRVTGKSPTQFANPDTDEINSN
ncbi:response regulator transcription factor [[Clostridium] polysaccharolyticum]|uniref:Stage 0 sporulation protein A homolog n=1 Tax=[Clostridium] polysaccharolyticum TaxID=29364 RepID=A0A1I0BUV0_9FIRM|nr:helix-turn-helix domain-containing protein [[Clostridium] polysaccharolyticum]SET10693.1 Two-component response regulator, YesN/AraC family, consists of REC and AraC-type DNA-binding domains [[Clostridium] polysaccharolyticum]